MAVQEERDLAAPESAVRSLRSEHSLTIAPYVLELGPSSVTFAWTSRGTSRGEVVLRGEPGESRASEDEATRHHRVRATGLVSGTTYSYEIDGVHRGRIRTPRTDDPVRFAVFGHPGGTTHSNAYPVGALARAIEDTGAQFALCTGDLCYLTTARSFAELFLVPFQPFMEQRPIYVAAGNHDGGFPRTGAIDYSVFRALFPYEYAGDRGPYHSFVRGNVHFLSVAYHPVDAKDLEGQLRWIEDQLSSSRSEFRIAYLGGANPGRSGAFDALFDALVEGGIDVVFGGDGMGASHSERGGVDYFFAGTRNSGPHPFFDVEVRPYEIHVRTRTAALSRPAEKSATIRSRRPKTAVSDLLPLARSTDEVRRRVVLTGIGAPSTSFDGVRVTARNPFDFPVTLYVRWGPDIGRISEVGRRLYREQPVLVAPKSTVCQDTALPAQDPLTGAAWTLDMMEIRFESGGIPRDYSIHGDILEVLLFEDPLADRAKEEIR
ncbi:MAG: metallophosphoesterase family protein [Planctomycetota bacterium]